MWHGEFKKEKENSDLVYKYIIKMKRKIVRLNVFKDFS